MKPAFEDGHFYSPVVNVDEAVTDESLIWPRTPETPGVDLNPVSTKRLLTETFPPLLRDYAYPETGPSDDMLDGFYEANTQFANADPRALFAILRSRKPRRVVEVGSGYSTLLMMDVNERFLGNAASITSVEPFPRPFLETAAANGRIKLIKERAQTVPRAVFDELQAGDILFIDSSHVSKTGSDVNRLFLDIIPRIAPGVLIHVHDVFLPLDYPQKWVITEGRSWNEQYVLQAFLAFNTEFRIVFGTGIARAYFPAELDAILGGRRNGGGSLWFERVGPRKGWLRRLLG